MVQAQTTALVTDFLVGRDQLTTRFQQLDTRIRQIGDLSGKGFINTKQSTARLNNLKKQFGELNGRIDRTFKQGRNAVKKFDATFLGLVFTGMALTRTFGGLFRAFTNTFNKLEDGSSVGQKGITQLTAAFEFFKFSIFDAFANTSLFTNFIDAAVTAANKVTGVLSDPENAELIFTIGGVGLASGVVLSVAGLLAQIGSLVGQLLPAGVVAAGQLGAGTFTFGAVLGLIFLFKDIGDLVGSLASGDISKLFSQIEDILGSALLVVGSGIGLFFNPALGAFVITVGLILKFNVISAGIEKFGNALLDITDYVSDKIAPLNGELEVLSDANSKLQPNLLTSILETVLGKGPQATKEIEDLEGGFTLLDGTVINLKDSTDALGDTIDELPTEKNIDITVNIKTKSDSKISDEIEDEIVRKLQNSTSTNKDD